MGIEIALMAASTAIQAVGAMEQADQQAAIQRRNAEYAKLNAKDAINRGALEQESARTKTAQRMGAQRAAMGASNIETESGTFSDILVDTATAGEKDAQTLRTNALRQAWGFESEAEVSLMKADAAETAGFYNAAGSILTGASKIGSSMGWFS